MCVYRKILFFLIFFSSTLYGNLAKPSDSQGEGSSRFFTQVPAKSDLFKEEPLRQPLGLFATISYLYWYPGEGGLDLATTAAFQANTGLVVAKNAESTTIFQNSGFSSGAKISAGYFFPKRNDWLIEATYTYLHHDFETGLKIAPSSTVGTGVFYFTSWYYQSSANNQAIAATQLSSAWELQYNTLDLLLKKSLSIGKRGWIIPFGGIQGMWIEQCLDISAQSAQNVSATEPILSQNDSFVWGIGPKTGAEVKWDFDRGFYCKGGIGTALLFTRFQATHRENAITLAYPVKYTIKDFDCLRPTLEVGLGVGWSCFIRNGRHFINFQATYDFNYLWEQNILRVLNDINILGTNAAQNALYLQGLTVSGRFDF